MHLRRTVRVILASAIALCLVWLPFASAVATPLTDQTAADRAALARAMERYEAAQADAEKVTALAQQASQTLDKMIAEQQRYQEQLNTRVVAMYRSSDESALSLLLNATSIVELAERLDLLDRLAQHDAENIRALRAARSEARSSAEGLLELQAEQARALDALAVEVAEAKARLAKSEATLKEYEARVAAAAKRAAAPSLDQTKSGTGDWKTAVASHYSSTFTGRGANGEAIGPYTMMVAHRTLPFGTLIEFEYNGKRAVAKVADRGPYVTGRTFDLGPGVVRVLGFNGVHEVRYRIISQ